MVFIIGPAGLMVSSFQTLMPTRPSATSFISSNLGALVLPDRAEEHDVVHAVVADQADDFRPHRERIAVVDDMGRLAFRMASA